MTPFGWFGRRKGSGLTPDEERVYEQLRRNRDSAVEALPPEMRHEFLDAVFSDRELREAVLSTFREPGVAGNRPGWFEDCLAARFGFKDFGARLVVQHQMNPDDVLELMLVDCDVDAAPPDA
jgi:hypothetical protein